jgi:hypothetical protein
MYSSIEKKAKRTIALFPEDLLTKYPDAKLWFKGYNMANKTNSFQIDASKSLYVYNLADLYVFKGGIVVVGKAKAWWGFGRDWLLSPFAICWPGAESHLRMVPYRVKYIGTELIAEDIDIEFQDPEYTKNIKLSVKHIGKELYGKISLNA